MGEVTGGDSKPWVVVLGGCGFIGRNLVDYLISNELVSGVRVVDKVPPQTAWLNDRHKELFENPLVEFKSANLINPAFCASALEPSESGPATWDLVVNCAGETKSGQTDPVYREGILALSLNAARECARLRIRRYIEISSGYIYNSDKEPHKEEGPLEPWTFEGKWKSQVEEELKSLESELSYTILRPAIVYGIGDRRGLTPRLLVGGVYKQLGETMKLLWTAGLRMNTVHVTDVCRAAWHVASRGDTTGQCYNVVDAGDTTQGDITTLVAQIFNINHDYWGTAMSTLAKTDLASVVDEANDKHLCAWAAACSAEGIANTPLEPSARPDLLSNKQLRLDGSKLAATGFHCLVERPTLDNLKEIVEDYVEMKLFPKSLLL